MVVGLCCPFLHENHSRPPSGEGSRGGQHKARLASEGIGFVHTYHSSMGARQIAILNGKYIKAARKQWKPNLNCFFYMIFFFGSWNGSSHLPAYTHRQQGTLGWLLAVVTTFESDASLPPKTDRWLGHGGRSN